MLYLTVVINDALPTQNGYKILVVFPNRNTKKKFMGRHISVADKHQHLVSRPADATFDAMCRISSTLPGDHRVIFDNIWAGRRDSPHTDWENVNQLSTLASTRWVPQPEIRVQSDQSTTSLHYTPGDVPGLLREVTSSTGLKATYTNSYVDGYYGSDEAVSCFDQMTVDKEGLTELSPHTLLPDWNNAAELMVGLSLFKLSAPCISSSSYPQVRDMLRRSAYIRKGFEIWKNSRGTQDSMLNLSPHELNWIKSLTNEGKILSKLSLSAVSRGKQKWDMNYQPDRDMDVTGTGIRTGLSEWSHYDDINVKTQYLEPLDYVSKYLEGSITRSNILTPQSRARTAVFAGAINTSLDLTRVIRFMKVVAGFALQAILDTPISGRINCKLDYNATTYYYHSCAPEQSINIVIWGLNLVNVTAEMNFKGLSELPVSIRDATPGTGEIMKWVSTGAETHTFAAEGDFGIEELDFSAVTGQHIAPPPPPSRPENSKGSEDTNSEGLSNTSSDGKQSTSVTMGVTSEPVSTNAGTLTAPGAIKALKPGGDPEQKDNNPDHQTLKV